MSISYRGRRRLALRRILLTNAGQTIELSGLDLGPVSLTFRRNSAIGLHLQSTGFSLNKEFELHVLIGE